MNRYKRVRLRTRKLGVLLVAFVAMPWAVHASNTTQSAIGTNSNVEATCTMMVPGALSFGLYDPVDANKNAPKTTSSTVLAPPADRPTPMATTQAIGI